jgi:hypothetical protein
VNKPRLSNVRTRILSQISIWFNQELRLGVEWKTTALTGTAEKSSATGHGGKGPALAFDAQILFDA